MTFQDILNQMVKERGVEVFDTLDGCMALLKDYAKGGFKKEVHLLCTALETGCHRQLLASLEPEETCRQLVRTLEEDYAIIPEAGEQILTALLNALETREIPIEEQIRRLEKAANGGDYQAQYALGMVYKKQADYAQSSRWFEGLAERFITALQPQPAPAPTPAPASIPTGFVRIQGGTFMMGSPTSEANRNNDEGPQHQVTVSAFYMGRYEVTQKEWQEVMGSNPSNFIGDNLPVEQVSWYEVIDYCNKRSAKEGLTPVYTRNGNTVTWNRSANGYRLPTEAEWEYACRAGTTTPYYTGSSVDNAGWYSGNSGGATHPVGQKQANAWGLYDMHGNVWEWCWDWYGNYANAAQTDPMGAVSCALRVVRGGSWDVYGQYLRSAFRNFSYPTCRHNVLGFRLVRSAH